MEYNFDYSSFRHPRLNFDKGFVYWGGILEKTANSTQSTGIFSTMPQEGL